MDINTMIRDQNVLILHIDGKIIGEAGNVLKRKMDKQIQQGDGKIVIDLSAVPLMDSAALGNIVATLTSMKKKGMKLVLLSPQKAVSNVLKITRLDTIFEIYEDESEAISAFA